MTRAPRAAATRAAARIRLPVGVWILGFVSMLMDIASEMIHALLPLFLVTLGATGLAIGLIEGLGESAALVVKVFSGALSDHWRRRKVLALLGYGLGALSKPLFALAWSSGVVLTARLLDRVGKGIRGAPRDALVADLTPASMRGAAFGLRQSLDSVGAVLGPLLAVGLMLLWRDDFRAVFWVAVVPSVFAVLLLALAFREPAPRAADTTRANPIRRGQLGRLGSAYWWVVGVGSVFTLARFSEAFLLLRAQSTGVAIALVPLVLVVMNVAYSVSAYPFGRLSDRISHRGLLAFGLLLLVVADIVLATAAGWIAILIGVVLWGVHMGATQGLLATMVADTVPEDLRGTGYGLFGLASGIATLLASVVAGWLWDALGASTTFYAGAAFGLTALAALPLSPDGRAR